MRPLVVLWLAATLAFPQTLVQRTYLVRAETATMDSYTRLTHVCVLVYPDGKYRLVRSFGWKSISANFLTPPFGNCSQHSMIPVFKPSKLPAQWPRGVGPRSGGPWIGQCALYQ